MHIFSPFSIYQSVFMDKMALWPRLMEQSQGTLEDFEFGIEILSEFTKSLVMNVLVVCSRTSLLFNKTVLNLETSKATTVEDFQHKKNV